MIEKSKFYFYSFCLLLWATATWGFIIQEVVPALLPMTSTIRLLLDTGLILLGLMTLRNRRDIAVIATFVGLTFFSSVFLNHEGIATYLNGIREFTGLLFMAPIVRYLVTNYRREEYIASFDRQLLIFLMLQMVAIPFQAVKYGVGDHGGGTLGDGMSGAVSTIIYLGTFYLITRRWDSHNYLKSLRQNWMYLLLLIPSFLNETKISFIYFFLFFLLLFGVNMRSLFKLVLALPFIIVGLGVAAYTYLKATGQDAEMFTDVEFYQAYLFGEDTDNLLEIGENYQDGDYYELEDQWAIDLPRFYKIFAAPTLLKGTKGGLVFGVGLGQFKGGTNMDKTDFARKNDFMLRGTVPLLYDLMIQMGLLGVAWFFWNLISAIRYKNRRTSMSLNIKVYISVIVLLQVCYGTLLTYMMVDFVLFYLMFRSCVMVPEDERKAAEEVKPANVNGL